MKDGSQGIKRMDEVTSPDTVATLSSVAGRARQRRPKKKPKIVDTVKIKGQF